jgi:cytochrome c5
VLSIKQVLSSSIVRTAGLIATVVFTTSNFADDSQQPLQLAALSDGFNAETTYMASCFACHSSGAAGAPKVGPGNAAAWAPRMEKGIDAVLANAIKGVNAMPPKGLCFNCTDDDLRAVIEYMVASSQ